jgi:hypothetical protein
MHVHQLSLFSTCETAAALPHGAATWRQSAAHSRRHDPPSKAARCTVTALHHGTTVCSRYARNLAVKAAHHHLFLRDPGHHILALQQLLRCRCCRLIPRGRGAVQHRGVKGDTLLLQRGGQLLKVARLLALKQLQQQTEYIRSQRGVARRGHGHYGVHLLEAADT